MNINRKPHTQEVRAKALKIMVEGGSARDVHEQVGVPFSTAETWMRDFKVNQFRVKPVRAYHSEQDRARAFKLFEDGKGYKAVANELAISVYTVRDWHREYQNNQFLPDPTQDPDWKQRKSPELRETVIALSQAGSSHTEIVKMTGVRLQTVRLWLRRKHSVGVN